MLYRQTVEGKRAHCTFQMRTSFRTNRGVPPAIGIAKMADGISGSANFGVETSRLFQIVTFHTLHLHKSELDQNQVLLDIMVIADEVDLQLMHAVNAFGTKITQPVV
jgi:hypothetical protein